MRLLRPDGSGYDEEISALHCNVLCIITTIIIIIITTTTIVVVIYLQQSCF